MALQGPIHDGHKCLDLILGGPSGFVTAGWLFERTGLTAGAATHILDRLEKRRLVERVRDTQDRRKVFIRVRPEGLEPLIPKYEEISEAYMGLAEQYDDRQLKLTCDLYGTGGRDIEARTGQSDHRQSVALLAGETGAGAARSKVSR